MKIGFGSDHAAIELKACLLEHLKSKGYECVDFGAYSPEEKMDYPIAGRKVAEAIRRGDIDRGVLVCGTGVGISLAANKVPGIRCALCHNSTTARLTREHNDANVLCFGERVIGAGLAMDLVDAFLDAEFMGGKHATRVDMFMAFEENR
jgi:ribose 5-phosphate isomerase B